MLCEFGVGNKIRKFKRERLVLCAKYIDDDDEKHVIEVYTEIFNSGGGQWTVLYQFAVGCRGAMIVKAFRNLDKHTLAIIEHELERVLNAKYKYAPF